MKINVQKIQLLLDGCVPRVLVAQRSELGRHWRQPQESADAHARIYHIEAGRAWVSIGGERVELRPGTMCLVPTDTPFAYECPRRVVINWAHFTLTTSDGVDFFRWARCPRWLKAGDDMRMVGAHERLRSFAAMETLEGEFERRSCLLSLLAPFMAHAAYADAVGGRSLDRLRPALEYLEQHPARRINVAALARVSGMAEASFSRLFARSLGVGPARYAMNRRVHRAQQLMRQTDRKLDDIAEELGFSDAFHLSKVFKRIVGASPRDYRRSSVVVIP